MKKSLSVNRLAWQLFAMMLENPEYYGVKVEKTDQGTTLVDAGVKAKGGFEAGRLTTQICMGGCAKVKITRKEYGKLELPTIFVYTDHPVIATLGSQYAGWQIKEGDYFAIGSGPARALALKPKKIYEEIGYNDEYDKAIMVLETATCPPSKLIKGFAEDCGVSLENLAIILTPTSSVAGATQISGRIVETGIHKLRKLGLDTHTVMYAWGCAPIPPTHPKFAEAMARTNDAILYGGTAYYIVEYDDEEKLKRIVEEAPSKASKNYGKPFIEIFKEANCNFYKIDPNLFAPAALVICNTKTGKVFKAGEVNPEILAKSLGF
ncbi:MAG TPA: methenyltetrahydromethanopterin cyclohydrolase [Candidatus Bathyarchaeia archaeon]|nr:methenyltetrahydromethanopterin cyclohydrolase [Candidatus Bathyarchaeia archaeon]